MSGTMRLEGQALNDAVFLDCAMARTRFEDVRLADARIDDVDLSRASFRNVNMTDVSIADARIVGLTVMGYDVQALIRHYETSTRGQDHGLSIAEPQLFVSDMDAACRFYVDLLGFDVAFAHGNPVFYAQVARGPWRLNLRRVTGAVFDPGFRDREPDALTATLTLGDSQALYEEFERAGVEFHQPLRTELWGATTFIVRDPDGNLIAVAGRAR